MRNERGSILMAVMLGAAGLVAVLGLFEYINAANMSLRYATQSGDIQADLLPLPTRLAGCLTRVSSTSDCPHAPELRSMMALAETAVVPINFSYADLQVLGLKPGAYSSAGATLTRFATPDDVWYGSTSVTVMVSVTPASARMAPRTLTRTYRVALSTPATFALIVRPAVGSAGIQLAAGSQLKVYGGLLNWSTSPVKPSEFLSLADVSQFWADRLELRADQFKVVDDADKTIFNSLRMSGLKLSALRGVSDPFGSGVWQQRLDYKYVMTAGGYPLPDLSPAVAAHGDAPDPRVFSASRASNTDYPDNPADVFTKNLETTCDRPSGFQKGSAHTLVLMRKDDSLKFDFADSRYSHAKFACGLVMARRITVNVASGETAVWYGHLNATFLQVTGGGKLIVVNPLDSLSRPSDLPVPTDMTVADFAEVDLSLASSTAFNFFVPFANDTATLPASLMYKGYAGYFEPCGAVPSRQCWKLHVDPPALDTYLVTCASGNCWYDNVHLDVREAM